MPSSYIELAIELLAEHPHDVLFIVLNYDTLLETALESFDNKFRFSNITDYIAPDRPAKVVKFHGSTNWFVHIPQSNKMSWDDAVDQFDISTKVPENEILIKSEVDIVRNHTDNGQLLFPLLAAPLAGKGVSDAVCPESHIKVAKEFLRDCQKFLIIGTSGLDEDLFYLLNSTLSSSMTYYHVHVVGFEMGAEEARRRFMGRVSAFAAQIPNGNVYSAGFRQYLKKGLKVFTGFRM